ncbi:MAG: extensin family protein [Porphyrobacter sp.]|nr:extensin family protein [Porphyrobacter sp.]
MAVLLAGCSALPGAPGAQRPPGPAAQSREGRQCLAELAATGAVYTPLPDRQPSPGCRQINAVQLTNVASDAAPVMIGNLGPVTCAVSTAFAGWARYGVDRAARQWLGAPVRSIETFGSYSCRNVAGTGRRSAHATAEAIDVSGFVLADGRRITVQAGWSGSPAERRFLRAIHASACRRFATVLGPDYNSAHHDHLHLEGVARGGTYCR